MRFRKIKRAKVITWNRFGAGTPTKKMNNRFLSALYILYIYMYVIAIPNDETVKEATKR